ncbi:MAG: rhodanese-like domain-containing protein [Candidatus Latescibacteria bacterium]|nr:rhodanese-like domain-containing protein [Candidatus Latescibacterota bacterium]
MSVQHIMPDEAHRLMTAEGYTYIDVRSIPEFIAGHPDPAVNIPLLHRDMRSGQMIPNPEFLPVVQAGFPTDAKLVIGCQSGMRSARAAEMLLQAGYTTVINVRCGFGGERDQFGRLINKGWAELGLPMSTDNGEGVNYESLAARIK